MSFDDILNQPDNEHVKIWRYMDFAKFVSLLISSELFFVRADRLDDPYEGAFPKTNVSMMKWMQKASNWPSYNSQELVGTLSGKEIAEFVANRVKSYREISPIFRQYFAINCWHMNDYESDAMWKIYSKGNKGIAIQSTYSRLRDSFIDKESISLGIVNYIDYETHQIHGMVEQTLLFYKGKSFEHEREIRAMIDKFPQIGLKIDISKETPIRDGLKIKVDINKLVEHVFVAPTSPDWFYELVKDVLIRFGYTFQVVHSKLSEQPEF